MQSPTKIILLIASICAFGFTSRDSSTVKLTNHQKQDVPFKIKSQKIYFPLPDCNCGSVHITDRKRTKEKEYCFQKKRKKKILTWVKENRRKFVMILKFYNWKHSRVYFFLLRTFLTKFLPGVFLFLFYNSYFCFFFFLLPFFSLLY